MISVKLFMNKEKKFQFKFNSDTHFYGKPCGNGHIGIRYISTNSCVDCMRMYDRKEYSKIYNHENRRTPRLLASRLLSSCRQRSLAKKWDLELTIDWIREKLEKGICEVTGAALNFKKPNNGNHVSPFTPSVDRIDSSKPYTKENCRIVCMMYNVCKGQWTDADVLAFAKLIVNDGDKKQL